MVASDVTHLLAAVREANARSREQALLSSLKIAERAAEHRMSTPDLVMADSIDQTTAALNAATEALNQVLHLVKPWHFIVYDQDGNVRQDELYYPRIYPSDVLDCCKAFIDFGKDS